MAHFQICPCGVYQYVIFFLLLIKIAGYYSLFTYFSVAAHYVCFQVLAIMNKAAVNIFVQDWV